MSLLQGKADKIAVIQYKIIQDDKEYNIKQAIELVQKAIINGANLICLPQTFATGMNFPSVGRMAEDETGFIMNTMQALALKNKVSIVFGMLEKDNKNIYDSAFILNKDGNIIGKYRRLSLLAEEHEFLDKGSAGQVIDTEFGKIGLLLGYDIRFPASCLKYFTNQVTTIICMSNMFIEYGFPVETICRARASDNVCYFVFVSCLGMHKYVNTIYMGRSMVIDGTIEHLNNDTNADIIAKAGTEETILYADLYFKKMLRYQKRPATRYYNDFMKFWNMEINAG